MLRQDQSGERTCHSGQCPQQNRLPVIACATSEKGRYLFEVVVRSVGISQKECGDNGKNEYLVV
jgi:hypothetical protein